MFLFLWLWVGSKLLVCVTMQSQVPPPPIFLSCYTFTVLPALSTLHQTHACSNSTLQLQNAWLSHFFTLRPPHLEQSPPVHHATLLSEANWKHLSFKNISAKQHCPSPPSVCAGCVCVDLAHGYTWTLVDVYIMLLAFVKLLITFSISVHIMCVKLCSVLWAIG